jgi:hypothetical protein
MRNRRNGFILLACLTAVLAVCLNLPAISPRCLSAPANPQAAAALVAEMNRSGESAHKRAGIYADFAFIACYATLLIWACAWAGRVFERRGNVPAARASSFMIGMVLATIAIDVAENVAMLQLLAGATDEVWLRIVKTMGRLKFTVPALPVVYVLFALIRPRGATPRPS